jgi:DNA polymerase
MSLTTRDAGLALLKWYADAGADEAIGTEAAALYAGEADVTPLPAQKAAETRVSLKPRAPKPPSEEDLAEQLKTDAADIAAGCATLDQLRAAMESFDAKSHFPAARNLVFADGNPQAKVMLIGEAPGEEEDRRGLPFVGRSGQLLDRMLAAIGLDRTSVYISNILPWRPMANRTPTLQEGVIFLPFLMRHIELAGPRLTVALGGSSAKLLLGTNQGIMRLRGNWSEIEVAGHAVPLLPTLHPAFLLRNPLAKREAWADLLNLKQRLKEIEAD